ncbi:MAG: membrane integrity-associated transporter subunit PqiC [Gemmatimonadales bacterium]|nr:MAG: membrane integrity-associated transporter subunit PqiC [Gemmatimonadales bacterium]
MRILLPPPRSASSRRAAGRPAARLIAVLPISLSLLLSGCFSLSRDAPPQRHYVLGAGVPGTPEAPRVVTGADEEEVSTLVGLRPPRLSDYLANPYLVVRYGSHRVEFSEFHRWGEELGRGINGTLALLLSGEASGIRAVAAPWPTGAMPAYLVQLQILRFEGVVENDAGTSGLEGRGSERGGAQPGSGASHLRAAWEVIRPLDGSTVARGTTDVLEPGWTPGDHEGLVRRLDSALGTLAGELAEALARVVSETEEDGAGTPG